MEVDPGTSVFIENITYTVAIPTIINAPPELTATIPDILLYENTTTTIDLNDHFTDPEGDTLDYYAIQPYNITIAITGSLATIIPDLGFTGTANTFFYADDGNNITTSNLVAITVISNITTIPPANITNATNVTMEQTIQSEAIIGQPVMWTMHITMPNATTDVNVTLPKDADNITVNKIENQTSQPVSPDNITIKAPKDTTLKHDDKDKEDKDKDEEKDKDSDKPKEPPTNKTKEEKPPKQPKIIIDKSLNETELTIEEPVIELEIIYYTDPPTKTEQIISNTTKQVVISSETGYTDIKASATLPIEAPASWVHLFWLINGTRIEVPFNATDTNNNSLADFIEWTVPHTSNQTYEIRIIPITKALHLDENRTFISDIYDDVRERDDVWSEPIQDQEYVRVTFKIPLDNTRDITIYARSTTNASADIEVYTENGNNSITKFQNIGGGRGI